MIALPGFMLRDLRGASKVRSLWVFSACLFLGIALIATCANLLQVVRAGFEFTRVPAAIIAGLKKLTHPTTGLIAIDAVEPNDGDKMKVLHGPLATMEGVFMEHRGATRSLLLLDILGRETAVEINPRLLQRIN